ncbi:caspase-7-like [Malaya genurostris]|uniref:caspase-7-like n=1 Tax=Malaya genurostris TaxID=325434 RepID=UPI0026F38C2A|nr:caspase-7-like [Malaya genurostris]
MPRNVQETVQTSRSTSFRSKKTKSVVGITVRNESSREQSGHQVHRTVSLSYTQPSGSKAPTNEIGNSPSLLQTSSNPRIVQNASTQRTSCYGTRKPYESYSNESMKAPGKNLTTLDNARPPPISSRTLTSEFRNNPAQWPSWKIPASQEKPGYSVGVGSLLSQPSTSSSNDRIRTPERYNLRDKNFHVIIFHQQEFKDKKQNRKGSEQDMKLLKNFFPKYRVGCMDIYENKKVTKVKDVMQKVSKKDFKSNCCLMVIIMSHGDENGNIWAYDGKYNFEKDIVERVLLNDSLKGKPKVFIVQACRGNATMEADSYPITTNKNDIIKCFGTYEGTVAYRDESSGTYFIQGLFKLLEQNGHMDLPDIMTELRGDFSTKNFPQVPTTSTTFTKKFYFRDLMK